jgi:recombination protein RecT
MTDAKQVSVVDAVDAARERFLQIAPRGLDFTAEAAFAKQLLHNNDYLKKVAMANPLSLQAAVINVAAIGLSLNPAKKQAYLIPRNVKHKIDGKDQWISKIFLEPSYMGLVDLATMSGSVLWAQAGTVHASDVFVDNGPGERPTHTYNPFDPPEKRGDMIGAYCVAKTASGDFLTTTMPMHEIIGIRDRSEAWKRKLENEAKGYKAHGGPWESDFGEQVKKTVLRRAFKTWPKTDTLERMEAAVHMSNENEGFEPILSSPSLGNYTADQKGFFDKLIETSNATGMFVFSKTLDESTFTNLYHSFENGQKGKYQAIVKKLTEDGAAQLRDITDTINEAASRDDDMGVKESALELTGDELDYIWADLSKEAQKIIQAYAQEQAKGE